MLKREFKINFKSFIIWTLICIFLFLISYLVYPSMINDSADLLSEMIETLPAEMLKIFNMDITDLGKVFGWFKSEGYICILIIIGLYSAIIGSTILTKEENDKTIEFLYSKPVSRNKILTSKIICGLVNIILSVIIIAIFNYIGLSISGDFDKKVFWLLSISPLLALIPIYFISLFISSFFNKTRKTMSMGIGLLFLNYFIQIISNIGEKVDFIKYFSLFTLTDSRNIILNSTININSIILSLTISMIAVILTYINFNKKEFL